MSDWVEVTLYVLLIVALVVVAYLAGRLRERMRWRSEASVEGVAAFLAFLLTNETEQFLASGIPNEYAETMLSTLDKELR